MNGGGLFPPNVSCKSAMVLIICVSTVLLQPVPFSTFMDNTCPFFNVVFQLVTFESYSDGDDVMSLDTPLPDHRPWSSRSSSAGPTASTCERAIIALSIWCCGLSAIDQSINSIRASSSSNSARISMRPAMASKVAKILQTSHSSPLCISG